MSNLKKEPRKKYELQDNLTSFISDLDSCLFKLDEIKKHPDFSKIAGSDFEILEELSQSTLNIGITILKNLHENTNKPKENKSNEKP